MALTPRQVYGGVPYSDDYKPEKTHIIALFEGLSEGAVQAGSWADLSNLAGTRAGQPGRVIGDAGTHTDPVAGGEVDNEGEYAWDATAAAWERVGDLQLGPEGPEGPKGEQGPAGPEGPQGEAGRDGVDALLPRARPGDSPYLFTTALTGGSPLVVAAIDPGATRADDDGQIVRISGEELVASRSLFFVETGREYRARYAFRRRTNSDDPANDAVRLAIAWYDQNKIRLAGAGATTVIENVVNLTTADGRQTRQNIVGRSAGGNVQTVTPEGAVYARLFIQTFGDTQETDIEVIDWLDVTDLSVWSPDVSAFETRVTALETINVGTRLDDLEAEVGTPTLNFFRTRADVVAKSIAPVVDAVRTYGYYALGDEGGALYKRAAAEPAHNGKIQSADGAWWEIVAENDTLTPLQLGAKGIGDVDESFDDTFAFEDAIAIAGRILIPERTFIVRNWFMDNYSNKTIEGVSKKSIMKHPAIDLAGSASVVFRPRLGDNITIQNFTIDGNRDNILNPETANSECLDPKDLTNSRILNMYVKNAVAEGIDIDDCVDTFAWGCLMENCGGNAVHISSGNTRVYAKFCTAINCGLNGVRAAFDCFEMASLPGAERSGIFDCVAIDCYRGFVLSGNNNTLKNCQDYGSQTHSLSLAGGGNHRVEGFYSFGSAGNGILSQVPGCQIRGVYVDGAGGDGVALNPGADYNQVFGLYAVGCGSDGLVVASNNNTVSTVIARSAGSHGAVISGNSNTVTNILSTFAGSNGAHVSGFDNVISVVRSAGATGVGFSISSSASRTTASDILTTTSGGSGIADQGANSQISNARAVGNQSGHGFTTNTGGGDYSNIRSHNSPNDGFNISGGENTFMGCRSENCGSKGFRITAGNDNYLIGCRSKGHGIAPLNDGGNGTIVTPGTLGTAA